MLTSPLSGVATPEWALVTVQNAFGKTPPNSSPEADRNAKVRCQGEAFCGEGEQWRMTILEGHQVSGFVIRLSIDPAAMQDGIHLKARARSAA